MAGEKELKIRMTLEKDQSIDRNLDDFQKHADKATDKATDGMKKFGTASGRATKDASSGMDKVAHATKGAGNELASLIKAQIGLAAIKGVAESIGSEWSRVAEDIGKASKEWQKFRASLQGVAALSGKDNSNKFAEAEIDRAERAHVTPEAAKDFREEFLAKASLYVGEGPNAKMSTKDADEFQTALMEYAQQKGVSQKDMAGFAGGLLAQQKGKTNAAEMMTRVGKTFSTLEASSASVSHLIALYDPCDGSGYVRGRRESHAGRHARSCPRGRRHPSPPRDGRSPPAERRREGRRVRHERRPEPSAAA